MNEIPSIEELLKVIKEPEIRKKWDINIKEFQIVEKKNQFTDVIKFVAVKQLSIIGEREIFDKRVWFLEGGVGYIFTSSIPDDIYPEKDNPVRIKDYLGVMIIKEDEKFFYFDTFNQIDIKISIPQGVVNQSLPLKVKEFFNKFFGYFNL